MHISQENHCILTWLSFKTMVNTNNFTMPYRRRKRFTRSTRENIPLCFPFTCSTRCSVFSFSLSLNRSLRTNIFCSTTNKNRGERALCTQTRSNTQCTSSRKGKQELTRVRKIGSRHRRHSYRLWKNDRAKYDECLPGITFLRNGFFFHPSPRRKNATRRRGQP